MLRHSFAVGLVMTVLAAAQAQAQEFPGLGVSDLAQWNMQQDAQFYDWAWQGSQEVARQLPDNVTSSQIIGAMQPYTVDNMYGGYNQGWWDNQQRQFDAVENWDYGAIRGEVPYYDNSGNGYYLPYEYDTYHYGNDGYIYGGESYYDTGSELNYGW
jgi:hypothetical protein